MGTGVSSIRFGESSTECWFTFKIGFKPLSRSSITSAIHELGPVIHRLFADIRFSFPIFCNASVGKRWSTDCSCDSPVLRRYY
ncbi:hypothetical protein HAX54_029996, partial [Datura stramonium]|nr:hypothetical protein [Datura stramonium]